MCCMAIKPFKKVNQTLESKIKDSQQNLFEFTLMAASTTDFSTFDILSVTRTDIASHYQCKKVHRKVNTQAVRVSSQSAQIIPLPKRK